MPVLDINVDVDTIQRNLVLTMLEGGLDDFFPIICRYRLSFSALLDEKTASAGPITLLLTGPRAWSYCPSRKFPVNEEPCPVVVFQMKHALC